jgi:putative transposase
MARPKKEHRPGGIYYIVLFGNGGQEVFSDDADMDRFVELLVRAQAKCNAQIFAYCTTKRDARVVVRVSDVPIGRLVQRVATQYSRNTHAKYETSGNLFQHPYKSYLLDGTRDLLEIVRHVHLAPFEAGDTDDTDSYRWSSHRTYLGLQDVSWLTQGPVLDLLGPLTSSPLDPYRQFMAGDWGFADPDTEDDIPPHSFHPSDDRFFRLASPACDQSAPSSHNRPGHRCGCPKDERRSRQAAVELA